MPYRAVASRQVPLDAQPGNLSRLATRLSSAALGAQGILIVRYAKFGRFAAVVRYSKSSDRSRAFVEAQLANRAARVGRAAPAAFSMYVQ